MTIVCVHWIIFPYKKKKHKTQKREIFLETIDRIYFIVHFHQAILNKSMRKKNYRMTELSYELSIVTLIIDLIIELAKHIEFFCVHTFVLIITIIIFKLLHSP